MELRSKLWIILFLLHIVTMHAACQGESSELDETDSATVGNNTLSADSDAKDTIDYVREMIRLVGVDDQEGRVLDAIRKTQDLLILESSIRPPRNVNFDILIHTANFYSSFDKRYGMEYYKKASAMVPLLPDDNPSLVYSLYTTRAGAHATLMEHDTAMYYYYKSIHASQKDSREAEASAYNNLGVYFLQQMQYDSAMKCFTKVLAYLQRDQMHIGLYCATSDNIAQIKMIERKYQDAYRTFAFNDSVYFAHANYQKALPNLIRLMTSMQQLKIGGIDNVIRRGEALIHDHLRELKAADMLQFYRTADAYYVNAGQHEKSIYYRNAYLNASDSLDRASSEQLHELTKSLLALQESNYSSEIKASRLEAEKTRLQLKFTERTLLISILSAGAIVVLLILYYRKRRQEMAMLARIAESELRHQQIEARMIEQELALKKRDITNIVLHNTQVYDFNQKMIDRLQAVSTQKQDQQQHLHSLLVELQQQNQIGDRALALQANIESVNEAFYSALRARYPDITKSEAELCGFIRINLSNKDISILKNVEAGSVKMAKNRLRKKLGITPEVDLYAFIQGI